MLRDLEVLCRTRNHGYHNSGALQQAGLVSAHETVRLCLGEDLPQQPAARSLRRLRLHDSLPRNGRGHNRAVRRALHLLDGIHRGQSDDRRAVLGDGIDGALDGGCVDQGPRRIVHQYHIIVVAAVLCDQQSQRIRDRLLPLVAPLDDMHLAAQSELGHLRPHALHLRSAHRDVDSRNALDRQERAQAMHQHGHAGKG